MKKPRFLNVKVITREYKHSKSVTVRVSLPDKTSFDISSGITCQHPPVNLEFPVTEQMHAAKSQALARFYSTVYQYAVNHPEMSAKQMKDGIDIALGRIEPPKNAGKPITECIDMFIAQKATDGTREVYSRTMKRIQDFDAGATLESISEEWLKRFAEWHGKRHKVNGTAMMLRNIRAVFNFAIEKGLTNNYPFRRYKIKHEKTAKRNLTLQQLRTLRDFPCEEFQIEYRDIFMLMFYLRGINVVDLLHLTKDNVHGDRIEYVRQKTNKVNATNIRTITVKIEPEAQAIIDRYRGKRYLLAPLERYRDYHDYTHHMNDALKTIGKVYRIGVKATGEPLFPEITTYWSRHSWASLAAEADIPMETIAYAMGHSMGFTTTEIYVNYSQRKIDEANRKVIDFLNADLTPPKEERHQEYTPWGWCNYTYIYT